MATTNPAQKSGDKYGDLKRRLWFLLGALIVYRIGTHIPVPGINASILDELFRSQQGGILGCGWLDVPRIQLRQRYWLARLPDGCQFGLDFDLRLRSRFALAT